MSETKQEVKTWLVRYNCDKPGCAGEMVPTGVAWMSYPMKYPHRCNQCGATLTFLDSYPVTRYGNVPT